MAKEIFFKDAYRALTGHPLHFPWQKRTFEKLAEGRPPEIVNLPTGTGKTSLIALWLIAIGWQGSQGTITLPRRLVWVVNRRVVVDQATEEAEKIIKRLANPASGADAKQEGVLVELAGAMSRISLLGKMGKPPVAVSTLRGQLADNGDWKLDPSRPAIIIGTVDMIGSRLLFSGYGDGKYKRPLHAGLLGHDAWVVLDEAHLTPAFAELLGAIQREQRMVAPLLPYRVSLLSATQRVSDAAEAVVLTEEDEDDEIIGKRLWAKKALHIHKLAENDDEFETIARLALTYRERQKRVLVFVKSPDAANKLGDRIGKEIGKEVALRTIRVLTGTQRGFERDALAQDPVFAGFHSNPGRQPPEITHYLIATAAGEVGADLDADHLVCDLTPIDSLIQRFGRVNRLGLGEAEIHLVVSSKEEKDAKEKDPRAATLDYLKSRQDEFGVCALSPAVLTNLPPAAFPATPALVPLARHWLDMWSLTSIAKAAWPERPEVAPWLHGVVEDLPETWVIWRDDVEWLADPKIVREEDCARVLDVFPILPHEQLREPTFGKNKMRDKLKILAQQRDNASCTVILLQTDGSIGWRGPLSALLDEEADNKITLAFATVLLPSSAGGLSAQGLFEPRSAFAADVADRRQRRKRFFAQGGEAGWEAFPGVKAGEEPACTAASLRDLIAAIARAETLRAVAIVALGGTNEEAQAEEQTSRYLLYFTEAAAIAESDAKSYIASQPQSLPEHNRLVGEAAKALALQIAGTDEQRKGLRELVKAFLNVGHNHDTGKGRRCWQRAIGNTDPAYPLAKSGHDRFNLGLNGGFRHEFGSLLDAGKVVDQQQPHLDLILHLIASHHGNARPHFREQGYDRESALKSCQEAALSCLQRFGHLQARYGWWNLAYLEALVKAADGLVSGGHIQGGNL